MACDTFLKISNKCKRKFVVLQLQEQQPFVAELLDNLAVTIQDLQPHQIHSFYESVGLMIGAEGKLRLCCWAVGCRAACDIGMWQCQLSPAAVTIGWLCNCLQWQFAS
jgi:hypothetical protein